jgi:hypothetical protein
MPRYEGEIQRVQDRVSELEQDQPQPESTLDQLKQLGELRDTGVLTEAEFEAQKAKILGD